MSTNIKVGLICLILVLAMVGATIAGAYFVFKPDEGEAPGEAGSSDSSGGDNNSTGGNSSNNTNNSNNNTTVAARYIDKDGCGYQTVGNVTYFFKYYKVEELPNYKYFNGGLRGIVSWDKKNYTYSNYSVNFKWSYDGIVWNDFSDKLYAAGEIEGVSNDYQTGLYQDFFDTTKEIYISYTCVTNCVSVLTVLDDLKTNVFSPNSLGAYPYCSFGVYFDTTEDAAGG
ncbi:MAG: hypothetical protein E7653_00160 [Ruminococcaceae bacterium]|nr:hypothetical protein [Oscillospiraceae bacterium]